MNDGNVPTERASTRCFACKLPADVLDALHHDRFQNGMGFESLAQTYALPEYPLSESGLRRHFSRHVGEPEYSPISDGEGMPGADPAAAGTGPADELDAQAVLEVSTKALTEMMASLVREHRAVVGRNPREADRLLTTCMKLQTALAKSIKQRDESRTRRQEFRKAIPQIVDRCTDELSRSITPVMRENAAGIRNDIVEYSHGRLSPEDLWDRLMRYERAWPMEIGERLRVARREALKAVEEAYVCGQDATPRGDKSATCIARA